MSVRIVHATPAAPVSKAHALRARDHWPTVSAALWQLRIRRVLRRTSRRVWCSASRASPVSCPPRAPSSPVGRPWRRAGLGICGGGLPRARAYFAQRLCTAVACGRGSHARQMYRIGLVGCARFRPRSEIRHPVWARFGTHIKTTNVTVMVPGFEGKTAKDLFLLAVSQWPV